MNLAQLRSNIDRRTGVRQDVLAANSFINEAINIISSRREWPWLDAVSTFTTDADTNVYTVPATYSETRSLNVGGVEAKNVNVIDADEFDANTYAPLNYEYAIEWASGQGELRIYPTPPAGTSVIHRYTRTESLLLQDTSEPLMPERYHSIIADLAASMFLERIQPTRAEYYRQLSDKALKTMTEGVQRKTNPGRIRIRPNGAF